LKRHAWKVEFPNQFSCGVVRSGRPGLAYTDPTIRFIRNKMPTIEASEIETQQLDVMNFLNEVAERFPLAISFASGRPSDKFFTMESWLQAVPTFVCHFGKQHQLDTPAAFRRLAQYGRTNGIINDLISAQVNRDEGIQCSGNQVLVTAGCQEAIDLCVNALCPHSDDVILALSPTYIGITGAAQRNRTEIVPFPYIDQQGILGSLKRAVARAESRGKTPRILYLVPDFDNPTGQVMSRSNRCEIAAFCATKRIVILEDNPYGMFRYEGEPIPSIFQLDRSGCVIYLGTYSKTICPTMRTGFAILPQELFGNRAAADRLLEQLSQAKSFTAVNTSQITQSIIGGILLNENLSLRRLVSAPLKYYRENRDVMLRCLESEFADSIERVHWNSPEGGFFLIVTLPFCFGKDEMEICAETYGVLIMPLDFFALDAGHNHKVRLAFSNVSHELIHTGIARFSSFVKDRLAARATVPSQTRR
jgi:(S)-3,5-dihydroxyphenylglycine transaminase